VEQLLVIAAAAVALLIVMGVLGYVAMRWMSFSSRVDRRSERRHQFEASWGAVLSEAERRAQAEREKRTREQTAGRR